MTRILTAMDVAEKVYGEWKETFHTLRVEKETCELAIAELARGRTLSPDCSADKVLDTVRRAIASGGANFYA